MMRPLRVEVAKHAGLLCFTDGSFSAKTDGSPPSMGWAVALFTRSAGSVTCIGVLNCRVPEGLPC